MTEKDAVKCDHIKLENGWYLQVDAAMEERFSATLDRLLSRWQPAAQSAE